MMLISGCAKENGNKKTENNILTEIKQIPNHGKERTRNSQIWKKKLFTGGNCYMNISDAY